MNKNPLVEKYGSEKRWVNWKFIRKTKIPFSPNNKKAASSTDQNTWSDFPTAFAVNSERVGIVFTAEETLLGIDIDHCISEKTGKITHAQKQVIQEFLAQCDTYTELSPSRTGLHVYLALTGKLTLTTHKKAPYEAYTSGRYFTVTRESFGNGKVKPVRTVTPDEALKLLALIGYPWGASTAVDAFNAQGASPLDAPSAKEKADQPDEAKKPVDIADDSTILERMFASKHGAELRSLYDGDISAHKNDASSADMALLSHFAFWTQKNESQMERLWIASPLGQREKTQKRKDYRDRTIRAAVAGCKAVYESTHSKTEKVSRDLDLMHIKVKGEKLYIQNTENMCRILRKHPLFAGRLRYDAFKNTTETRDTKESAWRDLEDIDAVNIQTAIQVLFPAFAKVGKDMVYDAMMSMAKENTIDSAKDYVTAIKWDGTPRLDTWLVETYGVEDTVYHRAVGSNWIKGLVKRICEPGCKFDYVLVLVGAQGIRKSTSLYTLGGSWHVETTMSTDTKDFFMQFQGKAIIEFSEGETMRQTDVKRMKAIISMQSDKYRPAYGRLSVDFPRRIVFAMTTNQDEFLKDDTGNRRWLPVKCEKNANIDWLRENRDQLFAEAYERVIVKKETVYEFPEEETLAAQNAARVRDPNVDAIAEWYFTLTPDAREAGITVLMAYQGALYKNMPGNKPMDKYTEMTIADILKTQLRLVKKRVMQNGVQATRWYDENGTVAKATADTLEKLQSGVF
jgi:primase-polymerase (primpol)-like protein